MVQYEELLCAAMFVDVAEILVIKLSSLPNIRIWVYCKLTNVELLS